jgi:hypothetical protein
LKKDVIYAIKHVKELETISQGHFDDLKYKDELYKVWLSRMTVADGMPYDNQVTVEQLIDGKWEAIKKLKAK